MKVKRSKPHFNELPEELLLFLDFYHIMKGDNRLSKWVETYTSELYSWAFHKVSDSELAKDLVQDTFLAASEKIDGFKGESSPKTWLFSILNHKIIDHNRRKINNPVSIDNRSLSAFFDENGSWISDKKPKDWHEDEQNLLDDIEFQKILQKYMDALPKNWNICVKLKYLSGKSGEEICQELEIAPTNLWQIVHRAKAQLREWGALTDHELEMKSIPVISTDGKTINNYQDILNELQLNPACHGEGNIHASYCHIDFRAAYNKVIQMQDAHHWPYGPFRYKGSNCSRFVNTALLAGKPRFWQKVRLQWFAPFTPTPLNNVHSLNNKIILPKLLKIQPFLPIRKLDKEQIKTTLLQPARDPGIPENAQWLSGEGAGSWFSMSYEGDYIRAVRYSPKGEFECSALFSTDNEHLRHDLHNYEITYPSNCREIVIAADGKKHYLKRSLTEKELHLQ